MLNFSFFSGNILLGLLSFTLLQATILLAECRTGVVPSGQLFFKVFDSSHSLDMMVWGNAVSSTTVITECEENIPHYYYVSGYSKFIITRTHRDLENDTEIEYETELLCYFTAKGNRDLVTGSEDPCTEYQSNNSFHSQCWHIAENGAWNPLDDVVSNLTTQECRGQECVKEFELQTSLTVTDFLSGRTEEVGVPKEECKLREKIIKPYEETIPIDMFQEELGVGWSNP